MPNTKNKIKYNLKNVYYAVVTAGDESTTYAYGTPKPIPGAVNMSLNAEGEVNPFYADGIIYYKSTTNNGYSGDITFALIPDTFRQDVLREALDVHGVMLETEAQTLQEPVHFALLFEFSGDQKAVRHILYDCTVTRPQIASQTKEASIEPVTETLSLSATPRKSDGYIKAASTVDVDGGTYNNWYNNVYEASFNNA